MAVNGPRGFPADWDQIDWDQAEAEVRRLRQRIFTASKAGEHRKVRSLQRLMLRSRANALLSVRRVAQDNKGKRYRTEVRDYAVGKRRMPAVERTVAG